MNSPANKPKVIIICGPTGVGKTAVGIQLAEKLDGEIISADSMQIYRYMDIGTAKPTAYEQSRIPHHMIDIVDPDEKFDAVRFAEMARDKVMQLHQRGVMPLSRGARVYISKPFFRDSFNPIPLTRRPESV